MMHALATPVAPAGEERRTPSIRIVREGGKRDGANADVDRFIDGLLAAAEDSVAGTSYAAARRRILRQLAAAGPLTLAGLSRTWPVTPHHLAHLVHELEQDGLVEALAENRSLYRLTADGFAALDATRSLQLDLIAKLLDATAHDERPQADAVWARLRAALGS